MAKLKEAWNSQAKAPRKGVKADDADEYQAPNTSPKSLSVSKSKSYQNQAKAPQGRGSRGPTQQDGGPITSWNVPVGKHKAYSEQCKWGDSDNNKSPSLGFKLSENSAYLGHFGNEENLRKGHNDSGSIDMQTSPTPHPLEFGKGDQDLTVLDKAKALLKGQDPYTNKPRK